MVADQAFPELRSAIDGHSVNGVQRVLMIKGEVDDGHTKGDVSCRHKCGDDLPSLSAKIGYCITVYACAGLTPIPAIPEFPCSSP